MPKASTSKAATAKDTARKTAKKPVGKRKAANGYQAPESIPLGEVLIDLSKQQWRIGPSIGSGGFGEIYCACKADSTKKHDDYLYVVKIVSRHMSEKKRSLAINIFLSGTPWKWSIVC